MITGDYEKVWRDVIDQFREELEDQEFALYFNMKYEKSGDQKIVISVPNSLQRDMVRQRYQGAIENRLRGLLSEDISLVFEVQSSLSPNAAASGNAPPQSEKTPAEGKKASPSPKRSPADARISLPHDGGRKEAHSQLREDYTFDKYVIGDNNTFAANAAMAISRNPGNAYNPFLIYGGVGLGKTHLMQAIGNDIHTNIGGTIIYITAESFTNEFIQAVQENKMPAFKNKYRRTDILLIDDIHFLQNKAGTQEELFYTFDALYNSKKQIVFTCDRPVSELKNLTDRLRSRFERGLNVDLLPPNYETRCAILKKKIETQNISIPDEVIALVSKNVSTNIRDLEAALIKLIAYTELVDKTITVEIAQQQLKDVFASPRQSNMSIETIQRVVAEYYKLSQNDLKGKKRTQNIVLPRQISMYIAREITEYSLTEIGQTFGGRDHTTVMHACKIIEERIRSDPTMDSTIQTLIRMIKEYSAKT
jgi:chromosomal replication initiator protein